MRRQSQASRILGFIVATILAFVAARGRPAEATPAAWRAAGGGGSTQSYRGDKFSFEYLGGWRITFAGSDPGDRRFFLVQLAGPVLETIRVHYRTAGDKDPSDADTQFRDFCRQFGGGSMLSRGAIQSPPSASEAQLVESFVGRALSGPRECIGSTISLLRPLNMAIWHQFSSPELAQVTYAHESVRPRAPGFLSEIGGGNVEAYLNSLDAWNTIVRSFRFASAGSLPPPPLAGRWETLGYGIRLSADGDFTEYFFGGEPYVRGSGGLFPDRHGRYHTANGRIGFVYNSDGPMKGTLPPNDCAYTVTREQLEICGNTFHRRP